MFNWIKSLFKSKKSKSETETTEMKYLIVGLGNIGSEYENTRHNIGFEIVDHLVKKLEGQWKNDSNAMVAEVKTKGRILVVIKPTTYMNLSGKAVNYWMQKQKIPKENIFVLLDDLNINLGSIRIREKGSDGGHNGLKHIDATLGGNDYARLRFGIGNEFHKGQQSNFVLGKWKSEEKKVVDELISKCADACISFAHIGIKNTMNQYNTKAK